MENTVRIQTMLPRVEDLEHSVQWTSLANDIDRLERLCRHGRSRRSHKPEPIETQRASVVKRGGDDDNRDDDTLMRRNLTADYPGTEGSRWSWKPRTDFEREYFYKDYKDYYCADQATAAKCFEPVFCEPTRQPCRDRDCYSRLSRGYPQDRARQPPESPAGRSSARRYSSGLDKEHFSDSRERLHEIFEHNRHLRRQFFANTAANARQDCGGGNQEAAKRYNGFGSTETLTSQSNQSSVSSINDRKSRWGQASRSPEKEEEEEEEEEEDTLAALARSVKSNVSPHGNNLHVDRSRSRKDGKVFVVNILPGSEVRHVDVRDVPVKLDEVNNERCEEARFRKATGDRAVAAWRRDKSLPEYIFGESTRTTDLGSSPGTHDDFFRGRLEPSIRTDAPVERETGRWDLSRSLPNLTVTKRKLDVPLYVARAVNVPEEPVEGVEPSGYKLDPHITRTSLDSGRRREESEGRTRSIGHGQSIFEAADGLVSPKRLTPRRVKAPRRIPPPPLDLTMVNEQCERMEADEGKWLNDYSVDVAILRSHEDLVRDLLTPPNVGYEQVDVVDVGGDTLSKIGAGGCATVDEEACRRSNRKRGELRWLGPLHRSCGDISLANELQSPQLVNSYRSSTCDLQTVDPAVRIARRPIDPDASRHDRATSPLFDRTGPIGGLQAGSALPSVYGPIPYKSPRRYVEGEVTIHYRSPVRTEAKEPLSEEELARRSAENMRRVYQEERRRKYLQELHDIDSRRHMDNFIPSQKSPIPLNRYDDFVDEFSQRSRSQDQTIAEPRLVARALYNFVGQSSRELTFRRGDVIFVRRQVDKNWCEGEYNAMIGLFPFNYVEILPYDSTRMTVKKSHEGQARAKFNFVAQTNLELSLTKGELVVLTRRVDVNWYEGRIGNRKGIFPTSYVEVITEPGHRSETPIQSKPVASPAAHSLLANSSSGGKMSMGPHHYVPSIPVNINTTQPHYNSLPRMGGSKLHVSQLSETLHIDTHSEPIPYRALYNYKPQNEDELELKEGDTVYVMEKCDDGWYVGSSQRTGYFGTFPGNYVERL